MKRLRGIAGVFLIFIFGVIVGAALTSGAIWKELHDFIEGGPDAVVAKISDRLNKELKLDDAQKQMLAQIVTGTRIKLREIRQPTQPQVEEALADAERKIRAILNAGQQKKFDQVVVKGREKWKDSEEESDTSR
jgi:hypothetical protein